MQQEQRTIHWYLYKAICLTSCAEGQWDLTSVRLSSLCYSNKIIKASQWLNYQNGLHSIVLCLSQVEKERQVGLIGSGAQRNGQPSQRCFLSSRGRDKKMWQTVCCCLNLPRRGTITSAHRVLPETSRLTGHTLLKRLQMNHHSIRRNGNKGTDHLHQIPSVSYWLLPSPYSLLGVKVSYVHFQFSASGAQMHLPVWALYSTTRLLSVLLPSEHNVGLS